MGKHKKSNLQAYRRRRKQQKIQRKREFEKGEDSINCVSSASCPDTSPTSTSSASSPKFETGNCSVSSNSQSHRAQKPINVLEAIHNDPLYIRMTEYLCLKNRLTRLTNSKY